jgi:hypothetical protein
MNLEGMIILSWYVSSKCWKCLWRRNHGPHADTMNLDNEYSVRAHMSINNDFVHITRQVSLKKNWILKHEHVFFSSSFVEDSPNMQERF